MLHTIVEQGPKPTVILQGEMDLDCAETLRWAIGEAAAHSREVTLDFAGVKFIDSSGTGIFVRLCLDMQQKGVKLRVRRLTPAVSQVFDMLRVRELIGEEIFTD